MSNENAISGFSVFCSVYLFMLGTFFLIAGAMSIYSSYHPNFQDEFFQDGNRWERNLGIAFFVVSAIGFLAGTSLCVYLCINVSQSTNSNTQEGVVYQSNVVYGPKQGEIVTPHGNPTGGIQQIYPVRSNLYGNNFSSYSPTYPPTAEPNILSVAGHPSTAGFVGYQHTPMNAVNLNPKKGDSLLNSQKQNSAICSSLSGNIQASAPYSEQNIPGSICPPSYNEATAPQSYM